MNPSPQLSLDFNPIFIPKSISHFLAEVSRIGSVTDKVLQVNDFVNRLESEMLKIEELKREIPLCMLLVNDAIVALKDESMVLMNSSNAHPVLEEFIPLKNSFDDDDDDDDDDDGSDVNVEIITDQKDNGDKKNWLSSTHLWNTNEDLNQKTNSAAQMIEKKTEEKDAGRAIVNENNRLVSCFQPNVQSNIQIDRPVFAPPQQHTFRKQRRRWSAELHRLFVNALQQLGGSQVATPKQIRELMKVDSLTNDEVKSHLQKYRLRTRRISSSRTNQSCVLVQGGSWTSKCSSSNSGSHDGPLLHGGNDIDDEDDEKSDNCCWSGNL